MPQMVMERTRTQAPPPARVPLWRQRNFLLLWAGQTISLTGSAVTAVGLPLAAITMLRASALQVGLLTAAGYGAFILVALPAGVIVDRLPKRRIMIWCDSVRLVLIGSVPASAALHRLTLGQLYAVALAAGVCAVFFDVSEQSYVPSLLDPEDLTEGFGKLGASASFAQVSGSGLASGLVAVAGAARAVTADALSYAASVTCLLLVKGQEPQPERRSAGSRRLRSDITQGLAFITRHPVLRKTIACAATGNLFIAMQISFPWTCCSSFGYCTCTQPSPAWPWRWAAWGNRRRHARCSHSPPYRIGPHHLVLAAGPERSVACPAAGRARLGNNAVRVG
jgi:MFS family permease